MFSEVRSFPLKPESPDTVRAILSTPGVKSAINTTSVQLIQNLNLAYHLYFDRIR